MRFVHLDFPLDGHPGAIPAARAARCAGEQGKFWEYHRSLMTAPGSLDDADLKSRAASLRLSASSFGRCLSSDRHDAAIQASLEEGEGLGVTGTPAYFVNGRMLSGARPLEDFTADHRRRARRALVAARRFLWTSGRGPLHSEAAHGLGRRRW